MVSQVRVTSLGAERVISLDTKLQSNVNAGQTI